MKEGWFNRFLSRIDGEDSYDELNTRAEKKYQGLLDDGERDPVKKRGWFTRFYRRVSGKELEEEFKAHQERMRDEKHQVLSGKFEEFDDNWLMSEFEGIHGLVRNVEAVNDLIDDFHRIAPPELIIFKGQYYIPLEGTIHEVDLRYQMEHSN